MLLDLDGCYVSRGKTTPTLHFLCRHGSHAIDAVSFPSLLILSTTVEPTRAPEARVVKLITRMDGGKLPGVPGVRGARESCLYCRRETLTLRAYLAVDVFKALSLEESGFNK